MAAKWRFVIFGVFLFTMTGCRSLEMRPVQYFALLAPFEGQDRSIGYEALYAIRLSLSEVMFPWITVLAVDDGGTQTYARDRVRVLAGDDRVIALITVGEIASQLDVVGAAGNLPVISAGYWGHAPSTDGNFVMSNAMIRDELTNPDTVGMMQLPPYERGFTEPANNLLVVASVLPPDDDFQTRYLSLDEFAPVPGLIATKTYETTRLILELFDGYRSRIALLEALQQRFPTGYDPDAMLYTYRINDEGVLTPVDRVVE